WDGAHMTILEDYQVKRVPSFGTLLAGVQADGTALNAALSDRAEIEFLRIKNSWGNTADPTGEGVFTGYFDLYSDYLFEGNALMNFVLPRAYTAGEPGGIVDVCAGQNDGDVCAASLTGDATNPRLLRCEGGATVSGDACALGCQAGEGGAAAVCKSEGGPTPPPPPPPPPGGDSCQGFCGGQSDAGCWCDGQCEQFGDCCADRAAVCG
ncbi:MAG TPA: hypothetical protein VFS00_19060, partial [Polyangiaceae bacterium]|nr:hypothetical protein [Polyangiaceae bacterium]